MFATCGREPERRKCLCVCGCRRFLVGVGCRQKPRLHRHDASHHNPHRHTFAPLCPSSPSRPPSPRVPHAHTSSRLPAESSSSVGAVVIGPRGRGGPQGRKGGEWGPRRGAGDVFDSRRGRGARPNGAGENVVRSGASGGGAGDVHRRLAGHGVAEGFAALVHASDEVEGARSILSRLVVGRVRDWEGGRGRVMRVDCGPPLGGREFGSVAADERDDGGGGPRGSRGAVELGGGARADEAAAHGGGAVEGLRRLRREALSSEEAKGEKRMRARWRDTRVRERRSTGCECVRECAGRWRTSLAGSGSLSTGKKCLASLAFMFTRRRSANSVVPRRRSGNSFVCTHSWDAHEAEGRNEGEMGERERRSRGRPNGSLPSSRAPWLVARTVVVVQSTERSSLSDHWEARMRSLISVRRLRGTSAKTPTRGGASIARSAVRAPGSFGFPSAGPFPSQCLSTVVQRTEVVGNDDEDDGGARGRAREVGRFVSRRSRISSSTVGEAGPGPSSRFDR